MSADLKGKKRKSGDNLSQPAKKVKTMRSTVKSAEKPAPLKPALKKAPAETTVTEKPKEKKEKKPKLSKKAATVPEPEVEEENDISLANSDNKDEEDSATLSVDQTAALLAGFSSDESEDEEAEEGIDVSTLPNAPTAGEIQTAIAKSAKNNKNSGALDDESTPGVIYISRLPHGFFEKQLRAYLSQFGNVTHLRLARNKKSGKSKHYAFVEFEAASVADIVAKTMDKYLLFGHVLQCKRVPQEQVKETMWKGPKGVKGAGKVRPRNRIEGSRLRKGTSKEGWEKRIEREEKRRVDKNEKLKDLGYEFEMPAVKSVAEVGKPKAIEGTMPGAEVTGVKLVKSGEKAGQPIVEETVVATIQSGPKGKTVITKTTTKRQMKSGGEKTATVTKKRKTKV